MRERVKVSFQKASVTPSKRKKVIVYAETQAKIPSGLSPLAAYIEENREEGITVQELIEQFQEYDCLHRQIEKLATTSEKITTRCLACGLMETKFRPGVK